MDRPLVSRPRTSGPRALLPAVPLALSLLVGCGRHGVVAKAPLAPSLAPAASIAPSGGAQLFVEPKAAVDALVAACNSRNENAVVAVFGEQARPLVSTGNHERDHERCNRLTRSAKEMVRIDPDAPGRAHVVVGHDDWKLPIPLVQTTGGWQFDGVAGAKEIAARRIGANELETIRVLRAVPTAQREFEESHGAPARRFASRPGRRDGLSWPTRRGQPSSPFAPAFGKALQGGGWAGYAYTMLPDAGAHGGFGAVARPIAHGETGIMTFVIDGRGQVWEKDLGASSAEAAASISSIPPDETWKPVPR